jgi:tRNA-splicing ligase RtcB
MTSPEKIATLKAWLTEPLSKEVDQSVQRLRQAEDVCAVALMPDVHLAEQVCVGAVVATKKLIYPAAVGGDIGCGMAAVAFDVEAAAIDDERAAGALLAGLYQFVPSNKHRNSRDLPESLKRQLLSDATLQRLAARDGRVQLGTLGRGNHFLEFQADQEGRLWALIHSGSRAMGQAITEWHLRRAPSTGGELKSLDAASNEGKAYLADVAWARRYACESRLEMLRAVEQIMQSLLGAQLQWASLIHSDHNHIERESHGGRPLWVHRKGAQMAGVDEPGIIPGSMGSATFHTEGRGCDEAMRSCSHGAGRRLSRSAARQSINDKEFTRQVARLWFDRRRTGRLRDEAPGAYKDIREVMRAQRGLIKIVRELRPLLNYKGM